MTSNEKRHYPGGSKGRVNRAGDSFRRGEETEEDTRILEEWRKAHRHVLDAFRKLLGRRTEGTEVIVAQRHKRKSTIVDKLRRRKVRKLAEMNDVAGCRLIFESVDDLYRFRGEFRNARFRHKLKNDDNADKYDYIKYPKPETGYRGVHDVYSYASGSVSGNRYEGLLVEIQYRTHVQHAWATAVEVVGFVTENEPKFGRGDDRFREIFRYASEILARAFENEKSCLKGLGDEEVVRGFDDLDSELKFIEMLGGLDVAGEEGLRGKNVILVFEENDLRVKSFVRAPEALEELFRLEKENPGKDIVLVRGDRGRDVRVAFRNYFSDASDFTGKIREGRRLLTSDLSSYFESYELTESFTHGETRSAEKMPEGELISTDEVPELGFTEHWRHYTKRYVRETDASEDANE